MPRAVCLSFIKTRKPDDMKSAGKNNKLRAIELNNIDSSHMAEPQADQYDTQITLALATTTPSPLRPEPHRCLPIASGQTICDGRVSVAHIAQTEMAPPHFPPAPLDHPNLAAAIVYLRRWPAAYEQFSTLIDTVHPCLDASIQPEFREVSVGSSSHSYEQWFGTVFLTVDNALGCAQALVHELAHQKLRALGVSFEQAWRLITNDPAVLYPSPIKLGRQRPMTAVLHAEYSFIYVTEL